MTLPDFVRHFFPDLPLEKSREMLQEILKVVLYKGNSGHQDVLRAEGKCGVYDPVPHGVGEGHHDLHATDEVHVHQHDDLRTIEQETKSCLADVELALLTSLSLPSSTQ